MNGHVRNLDTVTWRYAELGQLCVAALDEAGKGLIEVYRAPARLWTETVGADDGKRHLLQTVSLCGRKVRNSTNKLIPVQKVATPVPWSAT